MCRLKSRLKCAYEVDGTHALSAATCNSACAVKVSLKKSIFTPIAA